MSPDRRTIVAKNGQNLNSPSPVETGTPCGILRDSARAARRLPRQPSASLDKRIATMKILVVIGHQNTNQTSFCHAVTQTAVAQLEADGHEVILHDLYAERFDPVLTQEELTAESSSDPTVRQHVDELVGADGYLIVHPNWWGQPPAVLKGWIDRVFRNGQVYRFGSDGTISSTIAGRAALVLTTSNTPREAELECYGDPLENLWKNCIFGLVGVTNFVRRNFESIVMSTPEQRATWLAETKQLVHRQFPAA